MSEPPIALSIIVPVFNERATIGQVLDVVRSLPISKQIIVVDDGSTDGTAEWLRLNESNPFELRLFHASNCGKGRAVRTALEQATGEFVVVQDADLETNPLDLLTLLSVARENRGSAVFGSRYLSDGRHAGWARLNRWGVEVLNVAVRILYRQTLTDEATCYKLFSTKCLQAFDLQCERFEFCPEVVAKACRCGIPILERPICYTPRTLEQGKKLRWRDGLHALATLWRYRNWKLPANGQAGQ